MSIGLIIDIVFLVLIAIVFLISLYRNPIFSLINLILFITIMLVSIFALNNLVIDFIDKQVDFFSLSEQIATTISSINEQIASYNKENGTSINLINEVLTDPKFVNSLLISLISTCLPIVYSLVSLILSYILSWIIFGILRATCLKKVSLKLKEKKKIRYLINAPISLLFVIFFGISFFNPINSLLKEGNSVINVASSLKDNKVLNEKLDEINDLTNSANELQNSLIEIEDELKDIESSVSNFEKEVDDLSSSYFKLSYSIEGALKDCKTLKSKNLSSEDSIKVNNIESAVNQASKELSSYKADIDSCKKEVQSGRTKIDYYLVTVDSYINELDSSLGSINDSLGSIKTYQEEINKVFNDYGSYFSLIKKSVLFSWLFDINIYQNNNFVYEDKNYSSLELVDEVIEYANYLNDTGINEISSSLSSALANYQTQIDEGKVEIEEAKKEIEENKKELPNYQSQIDEAKTKLNEAINEFNDKISILEELKTKYNIA